MANPRMTLLDLLSKAEQGADPDFLRDGLKLLAQELMDAEVTQLVGAGLHERAETRLTYRNGYREREWDTRVGTIELDIPKLRAGTYFPSLLEPRPRHERALLSVVQEAYIHGVSTRAVDALAEALGLKGISKDQVSRICKPDHHRASARSARTGAANRLTAATPGSLSPWLWQSGQRPDEPPPTRDRSAPGTPAAHNLSAASVAVSGGGAGVSDRGERTGLIDAPRYHAAEVKGDSRDIPHRARVSMAIWRRRLGLRLGDCQVGGRLVWAPRTRLRPARTTASSERACMAA
jgi:hypothetical protein